MFNIKKIIILTFIILSGCSSINKTENGVTTYSCESDYVKYLKYEEEEILKFSKMIKKNAFFIGDTESIETCSSYPCRTCKLFMCKNPNFESIHYINSNGELVEAKRYRFFKYGQYENIKKFGNSKNIEQSDSKYAWVVKRENGYEYEKISNNENGNLVYEIVTPIENKLKSNISVCDTLVFSKYSEFYLNFSK